MEVGLPLDFILYLEGVPVDFETISLDLQLGAPATATISIPPTVLSQKILPRTSVHIFYMDNDEVYSSEAPKELVNKPVFKLLFEGEVMALSYNKTTEGRATTLICSDITNNFDYAYRYVIEDVAPLSGSPCDEAVSGTKSTVGLVNNSTLGGPIARFITGKDTIAEGVKALIKAVFTGDQTLSANPTNEFLESVEDRYRISERVSALTDEEIKLLAKIRNLSEIGARAVGRTPPNVSLTQIVNMFLSFIFYNRISMLTPSFNNGIIQTLVLLPNIYFSAPPKCNVLFPEHVGNIGYTDFFLQTPTRLLLQTPALGTNRPGSRFLQCSQTYLAPRELSSLLPTGGRGLAKNENDLHRKLTSEEKIKGIVPIFKVVGQPEYQTSLGERKETEDETLGKERDSPRNYMLNIAEYELEVRKAQTRNVNSITGPFNPEVVVGAPIVVLDDVLFIFGMLQRVSHVISANSGANTTYSISLSRRIPTQFDSLQLRTDEEAAAFATINNIIEADRNASDESRQENNLNSLSAPLDILVQFKSDSRLIDVVRRLIGSALNERDSIIKQYDDLVNDGIFEERPETPRWINSKFNDENASQSYKDLYGCGSLMDPIAESSSTETFSSLSKAASRLMDAYNVSEDRFGFTRRYTKRSTITTQHDFNNFYNLSPLRDRSQAYPATGPFTTRRRNAIVRYVNDLRLNRAHLGS